MLFQISVGSNTIFSMELYSVYLILFLSVAVILLLVIFIWKKISEGKVMKYEFITIIAHKFRTPLTHLKWSVENLLTLNLDPSAQESVKDIGSSTEKLINLTGTLIELTDNANQSRALYNFEKIPLFEFVKNATSPFRDTFHGKNIFFSVYCDNDGTLIRVDRARMEFVLGTILENACNYTPVGRSVSVKAGTVGRRAVIEVADTGIGIDPMEQMRLFEKFHRGDRARRADTEGVGVGLYLARSVMKRHKGRIEISSPGIDKGTTVRIFLPRYSN